MSNNILKKIPVFFAYLSSEGGIDMLFGLIFILGCVLASSIVCLNYRHEHALSYFYPRSFCEHCHTTLKWWQLIPVLGYFLQKGHCYFCKQKIDPKSTLVELSFATLLVIFCTLLPPALWANFIWGSSWLLSLSLQDLERKEIAISVLFIGGGILLLSAPLHLTLLDLAGGATFLSLMFIENMRHKLGYGDTFVIMFLWLNLGSKQALLLLLSASFLALSYYLLFSQKESLPFIPFIFCGYLFSYIFVGKALLRF